jgi:hypothetical protein
MLANAPMDEVEAVISLGTKIYRLQRGLLILLNLFTELPRRILEGYLSESGLPTNTILGNSDRIRRAGASKSPGSSRCANEKPRPWIDA